jgi:hypothetical protein
MLSYCCINQQGKNLWHIVIIRDRDVLETYGFSGNDNLIRPDLNFLGGVEIQLKGAVKFQST